MIKANKTLIYLFVLTLVGAVCTIAIVFRAYSNAAFFDEKAIQALAGPSMVTPRVPQQE